MLENIFLLLLYVGGFAIYLAFAALISDAVINRGKDND